VTADATSESSREELVLTSTGRDRSGLVERLAGIIAEHSGNWIDSSMARLGGEFAGIIRISVPRASMAAMEAAFAGLSAEGIDATIRKMEAVEPVPARRVNLELTGLDHTGIVLEVTRALAGQGISIDELHTEVFVGSMGGEPMFSAKADLVLPQGLDLDRLRGTLEEIASDIMVDIELAET
jgi:glycine cleavage system regulatory protein